MSVGPVCQIVEYDASNGSCIDEIDKPEWRCCQWSMYRTSQRALELGPGVAMSSKRMRLFEAMPRRVEWEGIGGISDYSVPLLGTGAFYEHIAPLRCFVFSRHTNATES